MNFSINDLLTVLPEIVVLTMASLILIVDLFLGEKKRHISYLLALLTLLLAAAATLYTVDPDVDYIFSRMFVDDPLSDVLKLMTYIAVSIVFVYSQEYIRLRGMCRGEFFALVLFAMLGIMIMISANHFMTLYLGLELLALSLYGLVALQRDSRDATEAAMKYFILGALASGLLLYGMSMLYGATGTLEITKVAQVIHSGSANKMILVFGLVFIVCGLAFKLGAVPFHMWVPDVYHGAPTAITLLLSSAPKFASFAFIMRLLVTGLGALVVDWQNMLIILAVLSMAIGNVVAIAQTNLKRMLAYSTISHMGFFLIGILSGGLLGYSAAMFYIIAYIIMTLGMFGMILLLSRSGFEAENLDDFKGLNQRSPWLAFISLLLVFSLAGVPPTIGFYAKLLVFQAAVNTGLLWLAVVAVLFSLIGAYYYLRIVKLMYFDDAIDTTPIKPQLDIKIIMAVNGLAVLLFGLLPQPLITLCITALQQSL
jgi:NADH-quinone oxidoreductase subunit N